MEKKIIDQSEQIHMLQNKSDDSEQYSRRNCVRIFGFPESKGENTDDIVLKLAKEKLGINIDVSDIDRSHRTGSTTISERSHSSKQTDRHVSSLEDSATSKPSSRSTNTASSSSNTDKKNAPPPHYCQTFYLPSASSCTES